MENERSVTMVRLYLPEASHSTRKVQMEKVLHLLCDQLHVHGVAVLQGMKNSGSSPELRYASVGDILRRNPDPPMIIEFFDESPAATEIRRRVSELVPNSYAVFWQATWEDASVEGTNRGAAIANA
jgi:PII-like signaling protein